MTASRLATATTSCSAARETIHSSQAMAPIRYGANSATTPFAAARAALSCTAEPAKTNFSARTAMIDSMAAATATRWTADQVGISFSDRTATTSSSTTTADPIPWTAAQGSTVHGQIWWMKYWELSMSE